MLQYSEKFAKIPNISCDKLVCVVTYKRKEIIGKWLRAWNNAEHYGTKLAVLHAFDGENPPQNEMENILQYGPDFYVPFCNTSLMDLGALIMVCQNLTPLPQWETLFWFTDDLLPMRRTFLRPFIEKISDPEVGLVAQCYEPKRQGGVGGHIRTVAYATKRRVTDQLVFGNDRFEFEHSGNHILKQVENMGYKVRLSHSDPEVENYVHWTSFLDWMWDCHLLASWTEYWDVYEEQFKTVQRWEDVFTKTETLVTEGQCEKYVNIPNKVSALVATCQAPINPFMWSIFSLLLNSDPNGVLEHILVGINGPDARTGFTLLQDKKQAFLEELRDIKWYHRDMPLTVVRTWSRVGHAQTLEQLIPWVHTEHYLLMHDDAILLTSKWQEEAIRFFQDEKAIICSWGNPMFRGLFETTRAWGPTISLPHFSTMFTLCKKHLMTEIGASWIGYHVPIHFNVGNFVNFKNFIKWHQKNNSLDLEQKLYPQEDKEYDLISMDIGTFVFHKIMNSGYTIIKFSDDIIKHFSAGSWGNGDNIVKNSYPEVIELEDKLNEFTQFKELYYKYKE